MSKREEGAYQEVCNGRAMKRIGRSARVEWEVIFDRALKWFLLRKAVSRDGREGGEVTEILRLNCFEEFLRMTG